VATGTGVVAAEGHDRVEEQVAAEVSQVRIDRSAEAGFQLLKPLIPLPPYHYGILGQKPR
jgi:hypothetical protein